MVHLRLPLDISSDRTNKNEKKLYSSLPYHLFFLYVLLTQQYNIFAQGEMGLDIGQPINLVDGSINANCDTAVFGNTCTPWVRLNFILGPWSSPEDTTLYSGKTWKQASDEIINGFVAKGIQIYGLIGSEAYTYSADTLEQYPGIDSAGSVGWINRYTYNFVKIVDFFKDRVRTFESFNEPNNWTNSSTAIVHPAWFSLMLQEIYLNTKYFSGHDTDSLWQVTLVSGALFTFDLNTGGSYINDTYWYGKNIFAWDWTYAQTGSYPLNGFGQHIYVEQGSSNVSTVTNAINTNLNDFWNNIYIYETDPNKKIWISEFGWESGTYGELFQSDNLTTSFDVLQNDARIRLAIWFTLMDFPGSSWGIYLMGNFLPTDRKIAYFTFRDRLGCPPFTSAIDENKNILTNNNANIFPNPFSSSTTIITQTELKNANLTIYNVYGQEIKMMKNISGEKIIVNGDNLSAGIYFIRLAQDNKVIATGKLIIE